MRCDALVLGGGPAGSAFAIRAAGAGMRVVVTERRGHAEARPGEHLAGSARLRLAALGVPEEPGLCRFSPGVLSFWRGTTPVFRSYGGAHGTRGFSTERARFDAALFTHAARSGATTVVGELVGAERNRGHWKAILCLADGGTMELDAGLVVDGTGRAAAFLRRQGVGRRQVGDLFAAVTWLTVPAEAGPAGAPLTIGACSYGWWSLVDAGELGDGRGVLSLVVYASQSGLRGRRMAIADVLGLVLESSPYLGQRLERLGAAVLGKAVYPAFPCRAASVWGDGWLALGDAAVALDPISGQGVTSALQMAERVAEVVEADPGLGHLGPLYGEALDARFETHLAKRQEVYEEAEEVFGSDMLERLIGVPRGERRSVRMAGEGHRWTDQSWSRSMPSS